MPIETRLYDLLEVPPDASAADIKKSFRRLALKHHPDRGGDTARFQDISAAHEILIDDEKRKIYNEYGEDGVRQVSQGADPSTAGGAVPADIFGSLFKEFGDFFNRDGLFGNVGGDGIGSRGRARQRRPRKHEDVTFRTDVTLEELFVGTVKTASITRTAPCTKCEGSGATKPGAEQICGDCGGRGVRLMTRRLGPGMVQQMQTVCSTCRGQGQTLPFEFVCKKCRGGSIQQETKMLEVKVPAGSQDGQRLVLRGEGDCLPGQQAGDVVFILHTEEHARFIRRGDHLVSTVSVTLEEALSGCAVKLEHLDGRILLLRSKPREIIKPGCWRKVAQEGMPVVFEQARGDLFIQFQVIFPDTLDSEAAQRLADAVAPPKRDERQQAEEGSWSPWRTMQRLRSLLPWGTPSDSGDSTQLPSQEPSVLEDDASAAIEYFLEKVDGLEGGGDTGGTWGRGPRSRL